MHEAEKKEALRTLAATLNYVSDLDVMMETILTEARRFSGAQAGSIYIREGDRLVFAYSQNDYFDKTGSTPGGGLYKNASVSVTGNSLASYVAREGRPLNIGDAYAIDVERPYRFKPDFDRKNGYVSRSVLTLPLKDIKAQTIGILQLINRLDENGKVGVFGGSDVDMMMIFSSTAAMALERAHLIRQMILRTIRMAELRDPRETSFHAQRVAALAVMLYEDWAGRRRLDKNEVKKHIDHLRMAAMLHDVGKVGVPDHVLNKPGRLTFDERMEMEKHVLVGLKLFDPVSSALDEMIREVVLHHHERWDGRGYPGWVDPETGRPIPGYEQESGRARGRKGDEISIFGRVTAVADVFDDLSSPRVYKEDFDEDLVCQIMLQEGGHHFDPELVDALLENIGLARSIRERFPD
ncbi:MAG: HD domain-containing protein [Candidatus Adiutrix sp.]|jgi:HD-GYP domain-containing protein (c-di-GMP phosphodiesterase class II)|nr:HD domain-containing protein [Candidatus Adiutrix sp.]